MNLPYVINTRNLIIISIVTSNNLDFFYRISYRVFSKTILNMSDIDFINQPFVLPVIKKAGKLI